MAYAMPGGRESGNNNVTDFVNECSVDEYVRSFEKLQAASAMSVQRTTPNAAQVRNTLRHGSNKTV